MKNPVLRSRALERLYQKALRLLREDEAKFDVDPDLDFEARAKEFVYSMSSSTLVELGIHVQQRHGLDALDDFAYLMPPQHGMVFALQAALDRQPASALVA